VGNSIARSAAAPAAAPLSSGERLPAAARALLLELLDRAHRAVLHQLRNARHLSRGWGRLRPGPERDARLEAAERADALQLERLDWIAARLRELHAGGMPALDALAEPRAAALLLAAALGWGTPEECRARLPRIQDGRAALALALWLRIQAGPGREDPGLHWLSGRSLWAVQVERSAQAPPAWWIECFAGLLAEAPARKTLVLRPGLLEGPGPGA